MDNNMTVATASHSMPFCNGNFTGQITEKKHLDTNCNNIGRIYKLQYSRYTFCNTSDEQSGFTHRLNEWLLRINKSTFCSMSNVTDIPQCAMCVCKEKYDKDT